MDFSAPPNLVDFTAYVYSQGVPEADLPDDSPYLIAAFNIAKAKTLLPPLMMPTDIYSEAVYNLGMDRLIRSAPDQIGETFFASKRKEFQLLNPRTGMLQNSYDETTGQTYAVPEFQKTLTLNGVYLQLTPWGRYYFMYAQAYGENIVDFT